MEALLLTHLYDATVKRFAVLGQFLLRGITKVRSSCTDQPERNRIVNSQHYFPLLIRHCVYQSVVQKAGVVN